MSIGSISRFVLPHKLLVVLAWLAVFIPTVVLIGPAIDRFSGDFTSPGMILGTFNGTGGITDPVVAVMRLPSWLGWMAPEPEPITGDEKADAVP